ncbi:hypothetical protein ZOSMA_216G00120 [Zostera marina]|uniref:Uncharacterized protein n=1 Tax=Zostera marina TaxID=29655 RepID=A0A0K9PM93_ZOSMR|nr:hypothetical protein ZOSMA_216G00120 [Zostera marina]
MDCSKKAYMLSGDCKICGIHSTYSLHRIHHHGAFITACTSCVLKSNCGSFCTKCFKVYQQSNSSSFSLSVHCSCCSSEPERSTNTYPGCENNQGDSNVSSVDKAGVVELENEDKAIAAAQISLLSLTSAAEMLRAKVIEKGKIATIAKKKSIEMLKRLLIVRDSVRLSSLDSASYNSDSESDGRKKKCVELKTDLDPSSLLCDGFIADDYYPSSGSSPTMMTP